VIARIPATLETDVTSQFAISTAQMVLLVLDTNLVTAHLPVKEHCVKYPLALVPVFTVNALDLIFVTVPTLHTLDHNVKLPSVNHLAVTARTVFFLEFAPFLQLLIFSSMDSTVAIVLQ